MKYIITILFSLVCYCSFGQYVNTTQQGSSTTLVNSRGGLSADSSIQIKNSYTDTSVANFSVASKYLGGLIRVGNTLWIRGASVGTTPNKWYELSNSSLSGYVPYVGATQDIYLDLFGINGAYAFFSTNDIGNVGSFENSHPNGYGVNINAGSRRSRPSLFITGLNDFDSIVNFNPIDIAFYKPVNITSTINATTISTTGLDVYTTNLGSTFTIRTKVDKGYVDSAITASPSGTVTSISQGYGITNTPNPITTIGTVTVDTTKIIPYTDTLKSNGIATKTDVFNESFYRVASKGTGLAVDSSNKGIIIRGNLTNNGYKFSSRNPLFSRGDAGLELQNIGGSHNLLSMFQTQKVDTIPSNCYGCFEESAISFQAYNSVDSIVQLGANYMKWVNPKSDTGYSVWAVHTNESGGYGSSFSTFSLYGFLHGATMFQNDDTSLATIAPGKNIFRVYGKVLSDSTSGYLKNMGSLLSTNDWITKGYSDSSVNLRLKISDTSSMLSNYLPLTGGTLSGTLTGTNVNATTSVKVGTSSVIVDNSEVLSVNGATVAASFKSTGGSSAATIYNWNNATSGDNLFTQFITEGSFTPRGSISYNRAGGLVAYNTTSDRRAKKLLGGVSNSGSIIDSIKVHMALMNGATIPRPMFVADELQKIAPYAVTGQPNAVDAKGNPIYQQVDASSLIPLMIQRMQDQDKEINELRKRISTLENNLNAKQKQ